MIKHFKIAIETTCSHSYNAPIFPLNKVYLNYFPISFQLLFFFLTLSLIYMTTPSISLTTPTHVQLASYLFFRTLSGRSKIQEKDRRPSKPLNLIKHQFYKDHPSSPKLKACPAPFRNKIFHSVNHYRSTKPKEHLHFV